MTVSTTAGYVSYNGDASTTVFAIPFTFDSNSEVAVYLYNETTGVSTLKTLTTHYTISGSNVTMSTAPTASEKLILKLVPSFGQDVEFQTEGAFSATTINQALDDLSKQVKSLKATLDNEVIRVAPGNNSLSLEVGTGSDGSIIQFSNTTGSTTVSAADLTDLVQDEIGAVLNVTVADIGDTATPTLAGDLITSSHNIILNSGYGLIGTGGTNTYPSIKLSYNVSSGTYIPRTTITMDRGAASGLGSELRTYADTVGGSAGTAYTSLKMLSPGSGQSAGGLEIAYSGASGEKTKYTYNDVTVTSGAYTIGFASTKNTAGFILGSWDAATQSAFTSYMQIVSPMVKLTSCTETQRDGNPVVDNGCLVFNSTSNDLEFRKGGSWYSLTSTKGVTDVKSSTLTSTTSTTSTSFTATSLATSSSAAVSTSSQYIINVACSVGASTAANVDFKLVRTANGVDTDVCIGAAASNRTRMSGRSVITSADTLHEFNLTFIDSPSATAGHNVYYTVYWKTNTGTAYLNRTGNDTDTSAYPRSASSLTVQQFQP